MKLAVFIDGSNFHAACRALNIDVDYARLHDFINPGWETFLRCNYYTAILPTAPGEHDGIRKLLDWLEYNGYNLVTKDAKRIVREDGTERIKGNMDIELAMDAVRLAPHASHATIFSGDGDFVPLVRWLQDQGIVVTIVSTCKTESPMISDDLRRAADIFIELAELANVICKQRKDDETS